MDRDASAQLFAEADDGKIVLKGMKCRNCGHVTFPAQSYGCEKCGAFGEALEPLDLAARGTLMAFATVNLHMGKDIETPFVVGSLKLDDGPTIRCTLVEQGEAELAHGATMTGRVVINSAGAPEEPRREVRFGREG